MKQVHQFIREFLGFPLNLTIYQGDIIMSKIVGSKRKKKDIDKKKKIIAVKKEEEKKKDSKKKKGKSIEWIDHAQGIVWYTDGSSSKTKKKTSKEEIIYTDPSNKKEYIAQGDSMLGDGSKKVKSSKKKSKTSFGETFAKEKAAGKKTFMWNGKWYHTQTKDEMEKAKAKTGPKESKTYLMKQRTGMLVSSAPKKKADIITKKDDKKAISTDIVPEKKKKLNLYQKFTKKMRGTKPDGTTRTQKEWEDARDKRRIQKRIDDMKERKNQGKNYSAKNLSELQEKIKDM